MTPNTESNLDTVSKLAWHTCGMFVVMKSTSCLLRNITSRFPFCPSCCCSSPDVCLCSTPVRKIMKHFLISLWAELCKHSWYKPLTKNLSGTRWKGKNSCSATFQWLPVTFLLHLWTRSWKTQFWTHPDHLHHLRSPDVGLCHHSYITLLLVS